MCLVRTEGLCRGSGLPLTSRSAVDGALWASEAVGGMGGRLVQVAGAA
jgi:hypothetical protein